MSDWLSVAEIRALGLPSMTECRLKRLLERFPQFPAHRARTSVTGNLVDAEFNVLIFPLPDQKAILRRRGGKTIEERIAKLGIGRPVAADDRVLIERFGAIFNCARHEGETDESWRRRILLSITNDGPRP